ncbi:MULTISPECIES: hypothetical protein [unclassified Sphingomonas]|uniref:hypothetical protein n=1 Tax=unclassified Sphingomonas TaxID=196159 RepID=UPI00226AE895|nr:MULTISPECIES: hypothetical protein [unclassified Sphingomonas]
MRESMLDAANALDARADALEMVIAAAEARIAELLAIGTGSREPGNDVLGK